MIKKAVPGGTGAPRGLPSKKRVCGLSLFWTSKAPGERFLDPGRHPKMTQNRVMEGKWAFQDRFFGDSCRFLHFSRFLGQICIDFGRKIDGKIAAFFQFVCHFLQHGDPHDSMVFIYSKPLFHFLHFRIFGPAICDRTDTPVGPGTSV